MVFKIVGEIRNYCRTIVDLLGLSLLLVNGPLFTQFKMESRIQAGNYVEQNMVIKILLIIIYFGFQFFNGSLISNDENPLKFLPALANKLTRPTQRQLKEQAVNFMRTKIELRFLK